MASCKGWFFRAITASVSRMACEASRERTSGSCAGSFGDGGETEAERVESGGGQGRRAAERRKRENRQNKMLCELGFQDSHRPLDRRCKLPQRAENSRALERIGEQIVDPGAELVEGGEGLVHWLEEEEKEKN